jgi:hypothetical protein
MSTVKRIQMIPRGLPCRQWPTSTAETRVIEFDSLATSKNYTHLHGMHMTYKPVFLIAVLSIWTGITDADGIKPPPTKPGLWETHTTSTQQGKVVSDQSVKMCQSNELTKKMQANAEEMRKKDECTSSVTQPSPNTFVEETRCAKGPNAGSVNKVIYTHQGDTSSHTEMHVNAGKSETLMTMDAKYLSSCPAGMKPGDLVIDGKVIPGGN